MGLAALKRRGTVIASAYGISCLAGAVAIFGYLVPWLGRGPSTLYVATIPILTGLVGGLAALPIACPLIASAERWGWRNPLIYLASIPLLFILTQVVGFALFWGAAFCGAILVNLEHALSAPAQLGYLISIVAAVLTYWVIRGRFSGKTGLS